MFLAVNRITLVEIKLSLWLFEGKQLDITLHTKLINYCSIFIFVITLFVIVALDFSKFSEKPYFVFCKCYIIELESTCFKQSIDCTRNKVLLCIFNLQVFLKVSPFLIARKLFNFCIVSSRFFNQHDCYHSSHHTQIFNNMRLHIKYDV